MSIINSKNDLCTGCNRCVRECPMETTNITYQDENGNIKVKIDQDKCIVCGRCISACKHEARYYVDDIERFFNDLKNGVPISLITAPSIRTNIPHYKKLFKYLKNLGVRIIYDVSLGADICIWAHVKYFKEHGVTPVITQPCPAIVSYCEMYRHDLLPYLSAVHSPVSCISIYMKKYKGITDSIALLSPCMAKTGEIRETGFADYNITFEYLHRYLEGNHITLPDEEAQFDNDESGLGSMFPMPGGLKENIEYFLGKELHITKAEGFSVYNKLDTYSKTPKKFLPDIYDVLNCEEGCNIGSAYSSDRNVFEIDKIMSDKRRRVTQEQKKEHYDNMYKMYQDTLKLDDFIREYKPKTNILPRIDDEDIKAAFERLGKNDYTKQNIDCGSCGSYTCRDMARKIALNVNIPVNCIFKTMDDVKFERDENIRNHKREKDLYFIQERNELQLTMLNAVVKATKIGLWDVTIINNDPMNPGNVFSWSDEFRFMLGYSNIYDFPNTFDSWNDKLHPDERADAHQAIYNHLSDPEGKTPYDVEYRLLHKNGEYLYFRACGESIRDKYGNAIRIAGAIMDITESKKILLNTEKQRNEAEEASKAKTIFLSNMSHEIRTPLNAIIGMTTIGKIASDIGKKDNAFFKIEGASKHLLGVINDILDMSKIEANKLELSPVSFIYDELLQKVADIVTLRIDEKQLVFIMNTDENVPNVLIGDDQRLTQVITNLLSNAVKFTPNEGSIQLDTRLLSETNGMCRIEISVSDTGIGIKEEQKSRLFESFEQADAGTSRNFGGTGLGLTISKRIIELMDGNISVESQPGKGSKFILNVLLKRGEDTGNSRQDDVETSGDYTDAFIGKTILLAEDVEINREIVIMLLEPTKLAVECAENGAVAVKMFTEAPYKYDLIFMDIQMPEMDGYQATVKIREYENNLIETNASSLTFGETRRDLSKQIPIVAMTANVFREDVDRCFAAGMNGHIRKPIDIDELIGLLRKYL
ncbi:MAG: ATP-binding protein [Treponema sp.]|nr:ATP-binding protein [Treponema sp.]